MTVFFDRSSTAEALGNLQGFDAPLRFWGSEFWYASVSGSIAWRQGQQKHTTTATRTQVGVWVREVTLAHFPGRKCYVTTPDWSGSIVTPTTFAEPMTFLPQF